MEPIAENFPPSCEKRKDNTWGLRYQLGFDTRLTVSIKKSIGGMSLGSRKHVLFWKKRDIEGSFSESKRGPGSINRKEREKRRECLDTHSLSFCAHLGIWSDLPFIAIQTPASSSFSITLEHFHGPV